MNLQTTSDVEDGFPMELPRWQSRKPMLEQGPWFGLALPNEG